MEYIIRYLQLSESERAELSVSELQATIEGYQTQKVPVPDDLMAYYANALNRERFGQGEWAVMRNGRYLRLGLRLP